MKKVSYYIKKRIWIYIVAVAALLIATILDLLSPKLTRVVVDEIIVGKKIEIFGFVILGFLGIGIGRCVFGYLKEYLFDVTASKISSDMRRDLFEHIQTLSASFFDKTNTGELMSRVKDDIDHIWDACGYVGMLLIQVAFHTTLVLYFMFRLNPMLAIIPLIAIILCGSIAVIMENKLGKVYEDISEENATLNTVAEENLMGVRTVKSFAREKFEIQKFLSHNKRYYDLNMKQSKIFVKFYPYFSIVTAVLPLLVLLTGAHYVTEGRMTIGELASFIDYSMNIVWPMEMLGWLTNSFSSAVASYKKVMKISAMKPEVKESEHPVEMRELRVKFLLPT